MPTEVERPCMQRCHNCGQELIEIDNQGGKTSAPFIRRVIRGSDRTAPLIRRSPARSCRAVSKKGCVHYWVAAAGVRCRACHWNAKLKQRFLVHRRFIQRKRAPTEADAFKASAGRANSPDLKFSTSRQPRQRGFLFD